MERNGQPLELNFKIAGVDYDRRIVSGIATTETLDKQGDVVDFNGSVRAFGAWPGNIREQHDVKKAVGKAIQITPDADKKQILVDAYISRSSDGEDTLTKVREGILTGFSIKGQVKDSRTEVVKGGDGKDRQATRILDYRLDELSLVDNPACPDAKVLMVKAAGADLYEATAVVATLVIADTPATPETAPATENPPAADADTSTAEKSERQLQIERAFRTRMRDEIKKSYGPDALKKWDAENPDPDAELAKKDYSDKQRDQMADRGQAEDDGSFPIKTREDLKNAIHDFGRAGAKASDKAHIIARARAIGATDLLPPDWEGSTKKDGEKDESEKAAAPLRRVLQKYGDVQTAARVLADLDALLSSESREGDDADDIAQLDALRTAAQKLLEFLNREITEYYGQPGEPPVKDDDDAMEYAAGGKNANLNKAGARHNKQDASAIQTMHDMAVSLGAECGGEADGDESPAGDSDAESEKAASAAAITSLPGLEKLADEEIDDVNVADLTKALGASIDESITKHLTGVAKTTDMEKLSTDLTGGLQKLADLEKRLAKVEAEPASDAKAPAVRAVAKTLGDQPGVSGDDDASVKYAAIQKVYDTTNDPYVKQALGRDLALLEMKGMLPG